MCLPEKRQKSGPSLGRRAARILLMKREKEIETVKREN
jgi:hypothetical protein